MADRDAAPQPQRPEQPPEPEGVSGRGLQTATVVAALASFALQLQAVYGYPALFPVAMLLHVWVGPVSLLAGGRMYHNFQLWQPFQGGLSFVAAQAAGWALYSVAVLLGGQQLHRSDPAGLSEQRLPRSPGSCGVVGAGGVVLVYPPAVDAIR